VRPELPSIVLTRYRAQPYGQIAAGDARCFEEEPGTSGTLRADPWSQRTACYCARLVATLASRAANFECIVFKLAVSSS